jgi:hypothetical protein
MIPLVAMAWIHLVFFVLVLMNIHEICLKLKSGFRIIHKFPTSLTIAMVRHDCCAATSSQQTPILPDGSKIKATLSAVVMEARHLEPDVLDGFNCSIPVKRSHGAHICFFYMY